MKPASSGSKEGTHAGDLVGAAKPARGLTIDEHLHRLLSAAGAVWPDHRRAPAAMAIHGAGIDGVCSAALSQIVDGNTLHEAMYATLGGAISSTPGKALDA